MGHLARLCRRPLARPAEPDPPVDRMAIEGESEPVDRHLMMEPAQREQIVSIGWTSPTPRNGMVDLKPVAAPTPVDTTPVVVSPNHCPSKPRGYRPPPPPIAKWGAFLGSDCHFSDRLTKHSLKCCLSDPRARLQIDTGLARGGHGGVGIDKHGHLCRRWLVTDAKLGKGNGLSPRMIFWLPVEDWQSIGHGAQSG